MYKKETYNAGDQFIVPHRQHLLRYKQCLCMTKDCKIINELNEAWAV